LPSLAEREQQPREGLLALDADALAQLFLRQAFLHRLALVERGDLGERAGEHAVEHVAGEEEPLLLVDQKRRAARAEQLERAGDLLHRQRAPGEQLLLREAAVA